MPLSVYNSMVKLIEIPDSKNAIVLCREKLFFYIINFFVFLKFTQQ